MALRRSFLVATMFLLGVFMPNLPQSGAQIGACYGMLGDNLPSPQEVVEFFKDKGISRMRIYDPHPETLQALGGSNIELLLGVPNEDLQALASSQENASSWIQNNVKAYPNVTFKYIAVGNEVLPGRDSYRFVPFVLPAMGNVFNALSILGLGNQVKVSTSLELSIVGSSFPPSQGAFTDNLRGYLDPIMEFLVSTNSPLLLNVYPYFSHTGSNLDYALFGEKKVVVQDGELGYQNQFDVMIDTVYSALEKVGGGDVDIVVSETGWPTSGEPDASITNAETYNTKLVAHVKGGTPKRPGKAIETYIFDIFDENQKTPERETHWGVFGADKSMKYNISFN